MIVFDTDTLSLAQHPGSPESNVLHRRILDLPADETVAATVISYEEQTRGWFAFLARAKKPDDIMNAYAKLFGHITNWRKMNVIPLDASAWEIFGDLRRAKLKV
jgi:tRNA(fMet)-specific endonuclease VapC